MTHPLEASESLGNSAASADVRFQESGLEADSCTHKRVKGKFDKQGRQEYPPNLVDVAWVGYWPKWSASANTRLQ